MMDEFSVYFYNNSLKSCINLLNYLQSAYRLEIDFSNNPLTFENLSLNKGLYESVE